MNINKFVCKWCDHSGKGYVTIGDMLISIVLGLVLLFVGFACILFFGLLTTIAFGLNTHDTTAQYDIGMGLLIDVIIIVCAYAVYKILTVKVAVCNRNKEN